MYLSPYMSKILKKIKIKKREREREREREEYINDNLGR